MKTLTSLMLALLFASLPAYASDGSGGSPGCTGNMGANGASRSFSSEVVYAVYPLCQVGQQIAAANDVAKLRDFLAAGCSATKAAPPGSDASLVELAIAYRRPQILEMLYREVPETKDAVNLYAPLRPIYPLNRLKAALNPFEIAVYTRTLRVLQSDLYMDAFVEIALDGSQLRLLNLSLIHI